MKQKAARAAVQQGAQDQDQQDSKKESSIREGQIKLGKGYFVGICLGDLFKANEAEGEILNQAEQVEKWLECKERSKVVTESSKDSRHRGRSIGER